MSQDDGGLRPAGWAAYQPGFKRPLKLAMPQAARNGWEERKAYEYETSPNERAVVSAMAWRAGDTWTVVIIDGSEPTFEKRGAPLGLALQSLRPKGYSRESFAGKKAHPLDEKRLAVLKDFVAGGMKLFDAPGAGLAFLDGGKTVWAGGLGVKELGAAYDEAMQKKVFDPIGMKTTTFDFAKALKGDVAQPHGDDVDGNVMRARMDLNYSVVPVRLAGGVWTSPRELAKYVEMKLAKGLLPDGKRLVSEENLLARQKPQVLMGEDVTYGMALMTLKVAATQRKGRSLKSVSASSCRPIPPWRRGRTTTGRSLSSRSTRRSRASSSSWRTRRASAGSSPATHSTNTSSSRRRRQARSPDRDGRVVSPRGQLTGRSSSGGRPLPGAAGGGSSEEPSPSA